MNTLLFEARAKGIIAPHLEAIQGKRILEFGPFHGQWTRLVMSEGAASVTAIEVNKERAEITRQSCECKVIHGHVLEEIRLLRSGEFDTVLCMGILYHLYDHFMLLSEIKRLRPKHIIIDTLINENPTPVIRINSGMTLTPSRQLLEMMLKFLGYRFKYFDWKSLELDPCMKVYSEGNRISLIAIDEREPMKARLYD